MTGGTAQKVKRPLCTRAQVCMPRWGCNGFHVCYVCLVLRLFAKCMPLLALAAPSLVVLHGCELGLARRLSAHGRGHCQGRQVMLVSFPPSLWACMHVFIP